MAKKKGHATRQGSRQPARHLLQHLAEAEDLMQQDRWADACSELEALHKRYPNQPELLDALLGVYRELGDVEACQEVAEQLIQLRPDDADLALLLAGAYLANGHLVHASRAFQHFLERWPHHPEAADVREKAALLERELPRVLSELGIPPEEAREVALRNEQVQSDLARGRYRQVRQGVAAPLQRYPEFVAAYNNLSLAQWLEGELDEAIATARRVLDLAPGNIHALSNLIHFLCSAGRVDEARTCAGRLTTAETAGADPWLKKAEGLSFLGDDAAVLQALQMAEETGRLGAPGAAAMLYHFGAVAALRLGDEAEARRWWRQAIDIVPGLTLATENLADLQRPIAEREGPWPFHLQQWVSPMTLQDLAQIGRTKGRRPEAQAQAIRRHLDQHPEVTRVVPLLLNRGDPSGRKFALEMARFAGTPELLAALRDFALSQHGSDMTRLEAAHAARRAGLLPAASVRMWLQGEWREIMLLDFEVHDEPPVAHSPAVVELLDEALSALNKGDGQRAEDALRRALILEPEAPDLMHNLAVAYEMQGRRGETEALEQDIHRRYPDYLFARVSRAKMAVLRGDLHEAREELDPLLLRHSFHYSELDAVASAEIELYLAAGNIQVARLWLETWERLHPGHPRQELYRETIDQLDRAGGLRQGPRDSKGTAGPSSSGL